MKGLSDRQRAFADCLLACGIAEQAAIEAGYSAKYARGNAHKLVANSCIAKYLAERRAQIDAENIAGIQEINEFWSRVLRGEEKDEQVIYNPRTGGVEIVGVGVSMRDRLKASEMRARVEGIFTDKLDISGNVTVVIDDDYSDADDT